jgi:hypothetical protein
MAVGFTPNCSCDGSAEWCDTCGGRSGVLIGTACARGAYWAEDVARAVGVTRDWTAFEGKAQAIALRWVSDLTRSEQARQGLARYCYAGAAKRWAEFRAGAHIPGRGR